MTIGLLALVASAFAADELRVGVFVGNNEGLASEQDLLFARADARKMRDLFVELGGMRPGDASLLEDGTRAQVERALGGLSTQVRAAQEEGRPTTVVFYYSGHGDEGSLHLGTTRLTHDDLRSWLEASGADVRIAMLDACQSGSAIRNKGGRRGPAFDFAVEVERTRGTAILTSSAASELSQESQEVGGGFFTHYLHTALSGAADNDRNGEVTLTEAYSFVHTETSFGTRDAPGSQTPGFDFDLVGSGDLALTTLEVANSYLSFLGDLDGTYSVWDESRKRYVAEVDGGGALQLAVRPGTYYVHRRLPGWVDEARYPVRRGETLSVFEEDFVSVPYEQTAARGDLDRAVRRARMPDLSVRALLGVRGFGNGWAANYIPGHAVGGLEARFLGNRPEYWGVDVLTGAGASEIVFENLGEVPVSVGSTSLGATVGFATKPKLFRLGLGGRAEAIGFYRSFDDREQPEQAGWSVAPGVAGWGGLHHGRVTLDLNFGLQMFVGKWDPAHGWPVFGEFLLAAGYRF